MTAKSVSEQMYLAIAVIIVGSISLGWLGSKAIDYTFSDVRQNTEYRVKSTEEIKQVRRDVAKLEQAMSDIAVMKEALIRVDERLAQWEPVKEDK